MSTPRETLSQMSDDLIVLGYQELEGELTAGELMNIDNELYIAYNEELKRRGIRL